MRLKTVYRNREFLLITLLALVKYKSIRMAYSSTGYLRRIQISFSPTRRINPSRDVQPLQWYVRQIDMIINRLAPSTGCVTRSLVKRDCLAYYGYFTSINFGILKDDADIRAHAWLSTESNSGYHKVHQVS